MTRINLHIYHSSITHESRMLKETKSLAEAGLADQIILIGRWREGLEEYERIDDKRQIWRVCTGIPRHPTSRIVNLLRYVEWLARIILRFRKSHVTFVNCHSIMELPLAPLFKFFVGSKIIYDTHELETETAGTVGVMQFLSRLTERTLIRFLDAVITVNSSIADWYRSTYSLMNVYAVRNIPYQTKDLVASGILKRSLGIPTDEMLFIYQGGLEFGRGIEILLDVFGSLSPDKHIVFMGMGTLADKIKEYAQRCTNIYFQEAVPPGEVQRYASSADLGIYPMENVCLNHYLSLPNKIFEYIMSGLPAIVSDFPEMKQVIDEGKCGWAIPVDGNALTTLITSLTWEDVRAKRQNVLLYRKTLGWHSEEQVMLQAYRDLGLKDGEKAALQ